MCDRAEKDGNTFGLASRCKLYDMVAMSVFVFWKLIKGVLDLRLRFYEIMILGVSALRIIRFEWSSLATGGQSFY